MNPKAIELSKVIYSNLKDAGIYPALTGGTLYKEGDRKDIDIVLFRNRQLLDHFEIQDIQPELEKCGLTSFEHYGFVTKCNWHGEDIDLFNPETRITFTDGNDYHG